MISHGAFSQGSSGAQGLPGPQGGSGDEVIVQSIFAVTIIEQMINGPSIPTSENQFCYKECSLQTFAYCERLIFIPILCNLPNTLNSDNLPPESFNKEYFKQLVRNNTTVLDCDSNCYTYCIKGLTPFLDKGLKSSRELCLFSFSFVSSLSLLLSLHI